MTFPVESHGLEVKSIIGEEMVVVMSPSHPLNTCKVLSVKDLDETPLILFERGSNPRKIIERFIDEQGITSNIVVQMENVEIIKPLVDIGMGITIIPVYRPVS